MINTDEVAVVAAQTGFVISDKVTLPGRPGKLSPMPPRLHPKILDLHNRNYPQGLYGHQTLAIESALDGNDVCLATSTASGKSLVFITLAAHILLSDPCARVIAMYPARALILDQQKKWRDIMDPLEIKVARIDGGIEVRQRLGIIQSSRVILMTPDVAQAWLMRSLAEKPIAALVSNLRLLVLDEAHIYEGVFGTNMAYLLRRFEVATGKHQVVLSTATLQDPEEFASKLTGRNFACMSQGTETHAIPEKTLLTLIPKENPDKFFEYISGLLAKLSQLALRQGFKFLAFADSRKMVEQIVVATQRALARNRGKIPYGEDDYSPDDQSNGVEASEPILPYRAGYEEEDRAKIQTALSLGDLAGVVSTSALELGIDIGEIDVVIFLGTPPSMKSFWQRVGRAGRRNPAVCLIIDKEGLIGSLGGLSNYVQRPLEPNWLYLENRYIQYSHVLCAATEIGGLSLDKEKVRPFESLPLNYMRLLDNEIDPKEPVPTDLYELKQRALRAPIRNSL